VDDFKFDIREYPAPPVEPDGILIKVTACGLCGSDLHVWRGEIKLHNYILGHELVGRVHSLGKNIKTDNYARPLKEGDRVIFTYFSPCHRCYHCTRGLYTDCPTNFKGFKNVIDYPYANGGYADYYYLKPGTFVFKVDSKLSDDALTPVNCAAGTVMEGIERATLRPDDAVVVQGAGGLGLYAVAAAKARGAGVIISIDGQAPRLELAKQCGATHTIDITEIKDPAARVARVKEIVGYRTGADAVVEVVGYPAVVPEGLEMLRPGGKYIEIGCIFKNSMVNVDFNRILHGIKYIVPVSYYSPWLLPSAVDMLERGSPLTKLMSHTFSLDKINDAFQASEWKDRKTQVIRSIVKP
jgi:D-arabinose 1-dehydrogenase-like Zn-dependent alcohol dehydrogenase